MPKLIAINAVDKILEDISDRRGLRNEWNSIEEDIQKEIVNKWINIIAKEIKTKEKAIDRSEEIKALKIWKAQRIEGCLKAINEVFDEALEELEDKSES